MALPNKEANSTVNWRKLARKPFTALGIETPGETARLIWRQYALGKPYYWSNFPLVWQIDTNNYCGPKYCGVLCEYCYPQWRIATGKNHYQEMPMHQIKWILENIGRYGGVMRDVKRAGYGWGFYATFLNGDGLTERRLPEILRYGKKVAPGIDTQTFTCATLPENAWMLCDANLDWVCVTLSAHTQELYRKVHRGDKFDKVLETLRYVTENRKANQHLEAHYVITKTNFAYMRDWYDFMGREFPEWHRVFSPLVRSFDNTPSAKAMGDLTLQQQEEAIRKINREAAFWNIETTCLRQPCVLFQNASVEADGTLLQCCNWADSKIWNYGNVADYMEQGYTLQDYWKARLANKLNNPLCQSCNLRHPQWKQRLDKISINVTVKP